MRAFWPPRRWSRRKKLDRRRSSDSGSLYEGGRLAPNRACIVGIGQTEFAFRGQLAHRGTLSLAVEAILAAAGDSHPSQKTSTTAAFSPSNWGSPTCAIPPLPGTGAGQTPCVARARLRCAARRFSEIVVVLHAIVMDSTHRFGCSLGRHALPALRNPRQMRAKTRARTLRRKCDPRFRRGQGEVHP
jgi:hypothetical protein